MPGWFTAWAETVSLFDVILWTGGIVAVILFVKRGWPTLKKFATSLSRFVTMVDSVAGLPAFIDRTDKTLAEQDVKIEEIHHEVHFNNGTSVKDAVVRVEQGVVGLHEKVNVANAEITKLQDRDNELADDIENTRPGSRFAPPKE